MERFGRKVKQKGRVSDGTVIVKVGFTLIELLVVIAIISLLVAILLPALSSARETSRAIKCASGLKSVGQAMAGYLAEYGFYPPSYVYASDANGNYSLTNQEKTPNQFGYLHWSWFLFNRGSVGEEAFQCPTMSNGGSPRTNPGMKLADWEGGQVDCNGTAVPNALTDKQVSRIAFICNAAIVPRNKFTTDMSKGIRVNKLVRESAIDDPSRTILAAELNANWQCNGISSAGGVLVKAHRSINPFFSITSGVDEYNTQYGTSFMYGEEGKTDYGLLPTKDIENMIGLIEGGGTGTDLNVIGRHHSGGDKFGGTSNFLFCDGHVERMTILQSMNKRLWGNKYYSLDGSPNVIK